jgi:hypothetical protein
MSKFVCTPLDSRHDRGRFDCSNAEFNDWFRRRAKQDQDRRVTAVHVFAPTSEPTQVAGFYSLSASSVQLAELPASQICKLPRYPHVPAVLIGRLARDVNFPGIGNLLLVDGLERIKIHSNNIAAAVIIVEAIDDAASNFYERFGFIPFGSNPRKLFLPIASLRSRLLG